MSDIGGSNPLGNTANATPSAQPDGAVDLLVSNAKLATSGARGSLAPGGSGVALSVLDAVLGDDATSIFGGLPSQNQTVLNQIVQTASARFSDMMKEIQDVAAQRNAQIEDQNNAWIAVKADINNAAAAVSTGQDAIKQVTNYLLGIRSAVALAGQAGEDVEFQAGAFDNTFNGIGNAAERGGVTANLVGGINRVDFSPNQIEYRNSTGAGQTVLTGTHIATDYRIMANDGTVWVPELGTDTITHYSALQGVTQTYTTAGIQLTDATSTRTGLSLVSYDPTTRAITVNVTINPDEPPRVVTGTLDRTGIGLMPAWFYDGLTTAAGRQRAFNDISAAEVNLTSAGAQLQIAANQVAVDSRRADAALSELTRQTVDVQTDQLTQQQALQEKSVQQLLALQTNLQALQSTQQNYLNLFANALDDPFGQSLLSMKA